MDNLYKIANSIPEMGCGGKKIKDALIREAKKVLPWNAIVDIAPFLGSTTAWLAYGLIEAGNVQSEIYSIDKFELVGKYADWIDKNCPDVKNLKTEFVKNILPFNLQGIKINAFETDIRKFLYDGKNKIQLLVDDIGVDKGITDHILKTTSPYFIPGLTRLVLMDFYFFEDYKDYSSRVYQRDLMEYNKSVFKFIERPPNSRTAIYEFQGGSIFYPTGEKYYYDFKGAM